MDGEASQYISFFGEFTLTIRLKLHVLDPKLIQGAIYSLWGQHWVPNEDGPQEIEDFSCSIRYKASDYQDSSKLAQKPFIMNYYLRSGCGPTRIQQIKKV